MDKITTNIFRDNVLEELWGVNVNEHLHFYYDESNNCRKFWINPDINGFNHDETADFVLAGVASEKEVQIPFSELKTRFNLQNNVVELKSKSMFKGKDFLGCMATKQVNALFETIHDYDLFIHYKHVNNFFYTIVEIMDSITNPKEIYDFGFDYFALKSTFYDMLYANVNEVKRVMAKYHYPNIATNDIEGFCCDLLGTLECRYQQKPEEKFLSGALRRASQGSELLFIQNNVDYLMQEDYSIFYAEIILKYTESMHHFDEELSIQPKVLDILKKYDPKANNYEFINSKNNTMVQLSDLVAGIIGKLFAFINSTSSNEMRRIVENLTDVQLSNCNRFDSLRFKSDERNKGLLHSITAIGVLRRTNYFFDLVRMEQKRRFDTSK